MQRQFFKEELERYSRPNLKVFVVDGQFVREHYDIDFTEGGHDLVYDFIPKGEVWLDLDVNVRELPYVLLHELTERGIMQREKLCYDDAHDRANKVELNARTHHDIDVGKLIQAELDKQQLNTVQVFIPKKPKRLTRPKRQYRIPAKSVSVVK
jgi:hypothetical protein